MDKIKIRVTAADIKKGVPCSWGACPIARAIRRATGTHKIVRVGDDAIFVGSRIFFHSSASEEFVEAFDTGSPVRPFTFVAMAKKL